MPTDAIEAGSGTLAEPMQAVTDPAAANGSYIQTISNNSGTAVYNFNIDVPGTYKIVARVSVPDGDSDSLHASIDKGPEYAPYPIQLEAGPHSIRFRGRIYGSNPVPVMLIQSSCKKGGDHIRTIHDLAANPSAWPRFQLLFDQ